LSPAWWIPGTQGLRFTLGEFCLFRKTFPCLRLDRHFTELTAAADAACPPVKRFSPEVEVIMVHSLPVETDLPRFTRMKSCYRYVPEHFRHYYIEAPGSLEDYLKGLDAKSRHELARKVRRFASLANSGASWREFRGPEEMDEYYRLALEVSRKTYQTRLLDAGMPEGESISGSLKNGQKIIIEDGVAKLLDRSAFAGSVATTERLVRTAVKQASIPLPDAVKMMTITPAEIIGISRNKGSLAIGKDADIVIFDDDINIKITVIRGKIVFNNNS
jgi:hypothetical protein